MNAIERGVSILSIISAILVFSACARQEPVSHFVISPGAGNAEISDADADQLKDALDRVAAQCHMKKWKSGQVGIIRYYQPTQDYEVGFFAKRLPEALKVYAEPMTPSVSGTDGFRAFRQNLANVLSQVFPGRVSLEK